MPSLRGLWRRAWMRFSQDFCSSGRAALWGLWQCVWVRTFWDCCGSFGLTCAKHKVFLSCVCITSLSTCPPDRSHFCLHSRSCYRKFCSFSSLCRCWSSMAWHGLPFCSCSNRAPPLGLRIHGFLFRPIGVESCRVQLCGGFPCIRATLDTFVHSIEACRT